MVRASAITVLVGLAIYLTGCLKRAEHVTVFPDGSMHVIHMMLGDEEDVRHGDAIPSEDAGWFVREVLQEPNEDDNTPDLSLIAMRDFPAGTKLPTSFAPEGSRKGRIALTMNTDVAVENREEGTYYHFRRVYNGRTVARIQSLKQDILETDELKELGEKDPETLSLEEMRTLIAAIAAFEREKTLVFVDTAYEVMRDEIPQDIWLAARHAAAKPYNAKHIQKRALSIMSKKAAKEYEEKRDAESEQNKEFQELEQEVISEVKCALQTTLATKKLPEETIARFFEQATLATDRHEIDEDLSDEDFFVTVVLPGKIIGHNSMNHEPENYSGRTAQENADLDEFGQDVKTRMNTYLKRLEGIPFQKIEWQFDSKSLYNRNVVLAVSSFVQAAK